MFWNVRMNRLKIWNHKVIVKRIWAKLMAQKLLIDLSLPSRVRSLGISECKVLDS